MKHASQFSLFVALAFLIGCANLERNTFRGLSAVAITVEVAMTTWGDWVRSGKANDVDEETVRKLYGEYQTSMWIAHAGINAYRLNPDAAQLNKAMDAASGVAQDLTEFIYGIVPPPNK